MLFSSLGRQPLGFNYRATTMLDHISEFVMVVLQEALHRPSRGVAQRADCVPFNLVGNPRLVCKILLPSLARQ